MIKNATNATKKIILEELKKLKMQQKCNSHFAPNLIIFAMLLNKKRYCLTTKKNG